MKQATSSLLVLKEDRRGKAELLVSKEGLTQIRNLMDRRTTISKAVWAEEEHLHQHGQRKDERGHQREISSILILMMTAHGAST